MRRFINTKARSKESRSVADSRPLLLFPEDDTVGGRDLYRREHTVVINAEATKRREEQGQDSRQHAGHYQRVLREHWDGLSEQEKVGWVEKAEKLQHDDSWEDPQIYRRVRYTLLSFVF